MINHRLITIPHLFGCSSIWVNSSHWLRFNYASIHCSHIFKHISIIHFFFLSNRPSEKVTFTCFLKVPFRPILLKYFFWHYQLNLISIINKFCPNSQRLLLLKKFSLRINRHEVNFLGHISKFEFISLLLFLLYLSLFPHIPHLNNLLLITFVPQLLSIWSEHSPWIYELTPGFTFAVWNTSYLFIHILYMNYLFNY